MQPVATMREGEGLTVVLREDEAERAGLRHAGAYAWITLRVHSALDAVGLTAAFTTALALSGLSANVIAGIHHDHVFVPAEEGERALAVLRALAAGATPRPAGR